MSYVELKYWSSRWFHKRFMDIVWRLPKSLAYMCAIRVVSHATTGKYANQIVPDLTAMNALSRWDDDFCKKS